jgi:hypothetical protein
MVALVYAGSCALGVVWYLQSYSQNPISLVASMAVTISLVLGVLAVPSICPSARRRQALTFVGGLGFGGFGYELYVNLLSYVYLVDKIVQSIWTCLGVLILALVLRSILRMNGSSRSVV